MNPLIAALVLTAAAPVVDDEAPPVAYRCLSTAGAVGATVGGCVGLLGGGAAGLLLGALGGSYDGDAGFYLVAYGLGGAALAGAACAGVGGAIGATFADDEEGANRSTEAPPGMASPALAMAF